MANTGGDNSPLYNNSPRYRGLYSPRDGWKCYADGISLSGEYYAAVVNLLERKYIKTISPRTGIIAYEPKSGGDTDRTTDSSTSSPIICDSPPLSRSVFSIPDTTNDVYLQISLLKNGEYQEVSRNCTSDDATIIIRECVNCYDLLNMIECMKSYQQSITDTFWQWKDEQLTIKITRNSN